MTDIRNTPRLRLEVVPSTSWGANLSQSLKGRRWDILRKETYRRANHRCEVCGGVGTQHPVDAHEVWAYDEETGIQRLTRLVALCPACHEVCHFGRAAVNGRGAQAAAHLATVNGWTVEQTKIHVSQAKKTWQRRSRRNWTLDLSLLAEYGVEPPTAEELAAGVDRSQAERVRDGR